MYRGACRSSMLAVRLLSFQCRALAASDAQLKAPHPVWLPSAGSDAPPSVLMVAAESYAAIVAEKLKHAADVVYLVGSTPGNGAVRGKYERAAPDHARSVYTLRGSDGVAYLVMWWLDGAWYVGPPSAVGGASGFARAPDEAWVPEAIVAPWRVAVFQGDTTGWHEAPELFCTTEPPTDSEEEPPPDPQPPDEVAPQLERILPGVPPPAVGPASSGGAATPHNQASLRRSRVCGYAPPPPNKQAISRMVSFVEKRTGLTVPELAVSRGFTEMSLRKAFGAFDLDGDGSVRPSAPPPPSIPLPSRAPRHSTPLPILHSSPHSSLLTPFLTPSPHSSPHSTPPPHSSKVTVEELTQILTRDSRASTGTAPMSVEDAKELIAAFDTESVLGVDLEPPWPRSRISLCRHQTWTAVPWHERPASPLGSVDLQSTPLHTHTNPTIRCISLHCTPVGLCLYATARALGLVPLVASFPR